MASFSHHNEIKMINLLRLCLVEAQELARVLASLAPLTHESDPTSVPLNPPTRIYRKLEHEKLIIQIHQKIKKNSRVSKTLKKLE